MPFREMPAYLPGREGIAHVRAGSGNSLSPSPTADSNSRQIGSSTTAVAPGSPGRSPGATGHSKVPSGSFVNVTEASPVLQGSPRMSSGGYSFPAHPAQISQQQRQQLQQQTQQPAAHRPAHASNLNPAAQRSIRPQGSDGMMRHNAFFGSSADAYAPPMQGSHSGQGYSPGLGTEMGRPETSMSVLSSDHINDGSSHGESSTFNPKRASVLSFQTALSGDHFSTFNGAGPSSLAPSHASEAKESLAYQDAQEGRRRGASPVMPTSRLHPASGSGGGYASTSEDDLHLPGGWGSSPARLSPDSKFKPLPADPPRSASASLPRVTTDYSKPLPPPQQQQIVEPTRTSQPPQQAFSRSMMESPQEISAPGSGLFSQPSGTESAAWPKEALTPSAPRASLPQPQLSRTESLMEALSLDIPASAIDVGDGQGFSAIASPLDDDANGGIAGVGQQAQLDRDRTITHRKNASTTSAGKEAEALPPLPSREPQSAGTSSSARASPDLLRTLDSNATLLGPSSFQDAPRPRDVSPAPTPPVKDERYSSPQMTQLALASTMARPPSSIADMPAGTSFLPITAGHQPLAQEDLANEPPLDSDDTQLADVVPPPLPSTVIPSSVPPQDVPPAIASAPYPVADFRATPLANVSSMPYAQPAALPHAELASPIPLDTTTPQAPLQNQAMRRGSSANLLASASAAPFADKQGVPMETDNGMQGVDRMPTRSSDSIPREDSPPPDGEVEARAEWERSKMKKSSGDKAKARERAGSRGSIAVLSPQELVANGPLVQTNAEQVTESPIQDDSQPPPLPSKTGEHKPFASNGSAAVTTQQLQKQQAKEQRRSFGQMHMQAESFGNGENGPYPAFHSPTASATRTTGPNGKRQYPGMMPQRSLIPPFELQQRPDALLSGLVGPDGVRKSLNDPDVCLECMMRDEDMIDVNVVGEGLWERESDKEFVDAIRSEQEEEARLRVEYAARGEPGDWKPPIAEKRLAGGRIRVKKVARGDPLTAERLKLHTQMSIPASSHRWRTLQAFLAVQAKYIAMEKRARETAAGGSSVPLAPAVAPLSMAIQPNEYDNRVIRASMDGRARAAAGSMGAPGIIEDVRLGEQERLEKERDIANARAARRKMAASAPAADTVLIPISPVQPPVPTSHAAGPRSVTPLEDLTISPIPDLSAGHHSIPRRSAIPPAGRRAGSAQDLRAIPGAMSHNISSPIMPDSPQSLAPPGSTFGRRMRESSNMMSPSQSGSMIDMHVGFEDHHEHRMAQNGFIPGTPIRAESPSAVNRAFYGFPGDGDFEPAEQPEQPQVGDEEEHLATYRDSFADTSASSKGRKKGLRGLFSKFSGGKRDSNREASLQDTNSKRSVSSGSPRVKPGSLGQDESYDLAPPPSIGGLLDRARRSTSSLRSLMDRENGGRSASPGPGNIYSNFGGMASQASFDTGPFGQMSSPLPPPRKESRGAPKGDSKKRSSSNLLSGKKPSSTRTSSLLEPDGVDSSDAVQNASRDVGYSDPRNRTQSRMSNSLVGPPLTQEDWPSLVSSSRASYTNGSATMSPVDLRGGQNHSRIPSGPLPEVQRQSGQPLISGVVNGGDSLRQSSGSSYNNRGSLAQSSGSVPPSLASPSSRNMTDSSTLVNSPSQPQPRRPPRSPRRAGENYEDGADGYSEDGGVNPAMYAAMGAPVGQYLTAEAAASSSVPAKYVRQLSVDPPMQAPPSPSRASMKLLAKGPPPVAEKEKNSRGKMGLSRFGFRKKSGAHTIGVSEGTPAADQASLDEREPRKSISATMAATFLPRKKSQPDLSLFAGAPSQSLAAGLLDADLSPPRASFSYRAQDRQRSLSTTLLDERSDLPPRSQSALGIASRDNSFGVHHPSSFSPRLSRLESEDYQHAY